MRLNTRLPYVATANSPSRAVRAQPTPTHPSPIVDTTPLPLFSKRNRSYVTLRLRTLRLRLCTLRLRLRLCTLRLRLRTLRLRTLRLRTYRTKKKKKIK